MYAPDYEALKRWAERHNVPIAEAAGRLVDLGKDAAKEDIAKVIRRRAVRRANVEAAEVVRVA